MRKNLIHLKTTNEILKNHLPVSVSVLSLFGRRPCSLSSPPFVLCHGKKFSSLALFCQPHKFSSWKSHDPALGAGIVVSGVVVVAGVVDGRADAGWIEQSPSNASKTNSSTATYPELESLWEVMNWSCKKKFSLIFWNAFLKNYWANDNINY